MISMKHCAQPQMKSTTLGLPFKLRPPWLKRKRVGGEGGTGAAAAVEGTGQRQPLRSAKPNFEVSLLKEYDESKCTLIRKLIVLLYLHFETLSFR